MYKPDLTLKIYPLAVKFDFSLRQRKWGEEKRDENSLVWLQHKRVY